MKTSKQKRKSDRKQGIKTAHKVRELKKKNRVLQEQIALAQYASAQEQLALAQSASVNAARDTSFYRTAYSGVRARFFSTASEHTSRMPSSVWGVVKKVSGVLALFGFTAALVTTLLVGKVNISFDRNAVASAKSGEQAKAPEKAPEPQEIKQSVKHPTSHAAPEKAAAVKKAPEPKKQMRRAQKKYRASPLALEKSRALNQRVLEKLRDRKTDEDENFLSRGQFMGLSEVLAGLPHDAQRKLSDMASKFLDTGSSAVHDNGLFEYCGEASKELARYPEAADAVRLAGLKVARQANLLNTVKAARMIADHSAKLYDDGEYSDAVTHADDSLLKLAYAKNAGGREWESVRTSAANLIKRCLKKSPGLMAKLEL